LTPAVDGAGEAAGGVVIAEATKIKGTDGEAVTYS
jgi:hypothetical protein